MCLKTDDDEQWIDFLGQGEHMSILHGIGRSCCIARF